MQKYPKIEPIFQRDTTGTKKLIPGKYCNETVEFLKDCQWVFTEKIDGVNVRVCWDGHRVSFAGRKDESCADIQKPLLKKLEEMFGGDVNEELFEQTFGGKDVTLFGEGYGANIEMGDDYRSDVSFILFDVLIDGVWLKRPNVEDIARTFGIDVVPIVGEGTLEEGVQFVLSRPKSTIGTADMEGVVARPKVEVHDRLGERVIVKIKVRDLLPVPKKKARKKKHTATVHISADEFDRINRLLSIDSLEAMSEEELAAQGAHVHHNEGIFNVTFNDGSSLNFDLCSGAVNYYDDVVWTNAAGNRDVTLDCEYELGDIEVDIEGETYIVKVIKD